LNTRGAPAVHAERLPTVQKAEGAEQSAIEFKRRFPMRYASTIPPPDQDTICLFSFTPMTPGDFVVRSI
jgi:hypothetical protein